MLDVAGVCFLERKQFGPSVIDREHDHREGAFHRRVFVKIVDDDLWIRVAFQLDNHTCIFIGFIANGANVREHFSIYQLGNAPNQCCAINVVGNFGDNDLFPAAFELLYAGFAAHFHITAARLKVLSNSRATADRAAGRKIRALHVFHQLVQRDVRVLDLRADSIDNFSKIVRRNIGGHANRDAGSTIDKKVRKRRWKNCRFGARFIVIGDKVDRVLVHVSHECGAQMRHPRFGVTHGRRRIAFD